MEMEKKMSDFDHDCLVQLTARNDLETYILNAQSEFSNGGIYFEFMTSKESENLINEIFAIDDWLNDDWEMNKATSEYKERLTKVKLIGDCYVFRYNEWQKRPLSLETYNKQIIQIEIWLKDERYNTKYKHITDEKIKKLIIHMKDASKWLSSKIKNCSNLAKTVDPPFFVETISKRIKESRLLFESIKNIPRSQSSKNKIENKDELEKDLQKKTNKDSKEN